MPKKVKQLIHTILLVLPIILNALNGEVALSPDIWKKNLQISPCLADQTQDALSDLSKSNSPFFSDLAPQIVKEGLLRHSQSFIDSNPNFVTLLLQDFEKNPRTDYRRELLYLAKLMNEKLQKAFFARELHFLLTTPKRYRLRLSEVKAWIRLSQNLPEAKQAFLMIYEHATDPRVRHFLLQAIKNEPKEEAKTKA